MRLIQGCRQLHLCIVNRNENFKTKKTLYHENKIDELHPLHHETNGNKEQSHEGSPSPSRGRNGSMDAYGRFLFRNLLGCADNVLREINFQTQKTINHESKIDELHPLNEKSNGYKEQPRERNPSQSHGRGGSMDAYRRFLPWNLLGIANSILIKVPDVDLSINCKGILSCEGAHQKNLSRGTHSSF